MLRAFVWLVLVLMIASPGWAATYYVSTTGNNSNDGLTVATAWLTVTKAVDAMVAGDTTYVRGGTYTEAGLRFRVPGTQTAPITLANYPGEAPIFRCADPGAFQQVSFHHASGFNVAIGWITLEGFEITNCYDGIKYYNLHDSTIRRNWIHDNSNQGIIGTGLRLTIDRNIINHNGDFATCSTTPSECNKNHGIYGTGNEYVITRNVIYDNLAVGIQLTGTTVYSSASHAAVEYSTSHNWIISDNTIAYQSYGSAINVWGSRCNNARIENNIIYQNAQSLTGDGQAIRWTATTCTGIQVRNNHGYATAPGRTTFYSTGATEGVHYTQSGNVVNVSAPAFVSAGSTISGTPDFRLTASAPVNICRTNEFLNNSTCVVGALKTVANPTGTITANKITLTFPMSTAVPIQVPSADGLSIACTGTACPVGYSVNAASHVASADSQAEVTVNGCTANNCANGDQNWTISYAPGSWTGFDNLGPYPGLHQPIFSFTNVSVTNIDSGGGPASYPGTPYIYLKFDEGAGTIAVNTGSAGGTKNATLVGGATFDATKGVILTGASGQYVSIPHGSGLNPTTQNMTIAFGVEIAEGNQSLTKSFFGSPLGTNQRFYLSSGGGTAQMGMQGNSGAETELVLTSGRNHFCVTVNAATDTVTLHHNGVASTQPGGVKVVTSYVLAGNWELGRIAGLSTGMGGTFTDFLYYESVEDCNAIYEVWHAVPSTVGTFSIPAIRFQAVHLYSGSPYDFGTAINQSQEVVRNGAVVVLVQINCDTGADCQSDSFRWEARRNETGAFIHIPDVEGVDHIYMWGVDTDPTLNAGARSTRLTGSCSVTNGVTLLTSAQVPVIDLPEGGCTVLGAIIRVGNNDGDYYDIRVSQQNGTPFAGTVNLARLIVVPPRASAF